RAEEILRNRGKKGQAPARNRKRSRNADPSRAEKHSPSCREALSESGPAKSQAQQELRRHSSISSGPVLQITQPGFPAVPARFGEETLSHFPRENNSVAFTRDCRFRSPGHCWRRRELSRANPLEGSMSGYPLSPGDAK